MNYSEAVAYAQRAGGGTITPTGSSYGGISYKVTPAPSAGRTTRASTPTLPSGARAAWEKAIAQYGPEGGYGVGVEAALERSGKKALASGMQGLVSAGLAGTTMPAGLGKKFEEEVAMPARAQVEETRAQAIANLQAAYAEAQQRGYETAEDRALRERLSQSQLGTQQAIAGMQTGLGYSQLSSQERLSSQELALQEMLAKSKVPQVGTTGGYGGSYGGAGNYTSVGGGGGAAWEPASGQNGTYYGAAYKEPETMEDMIARWKLAKSGY